MSIEAGQLVAEFKACADALQEQIDAKQISADTKIHKQQFFTHDGKTVIEVRAR